MLMRANFEVRPPAHHWLDSQCCRQLFEERLAACSPLGRLGAIDAMNEFGQAYRRQRRFLIACRVRHALDQLFNRFAATLGRDHHTGVEDQSHAGELSGSR